MMAAAVAPVGGDALPFAANDILFGSNDSFFDSFNRCISVNFRLSFDWIDFAEKDDSNSVCSL